MAYVANQLSLVGATIEGNWNTAVYINATDSLATVLGANYITDGQIRGLEIGDPIWLVLGSGAAAVTYLAYVSAVQALASGNGVTLAGIGGGTANPSLPPAQYVTAALQSATMTAAQVAGSAICCFDNTGTTPANLATPTAAAIIAAVPNWQVGQSYILKIRNSSGSANTATITAGTGVTLTGTMTIAQTVTREFVVTYTGAAAVTIQSMGISAAGA